MTGFSKKTRSMILARCEGFCEGCGLVTHRLELHHRQYRSRGGSDKPSNGIALCGWGNHTGCHGRAHTKAGEDLGWSVRSGFDPRMEPVKLFDGREWWLTDWGTREPHAPEIEF